MKTDLLAYQIAQIKLLKGARVRYTKYLLSNVYASKFSTSTAISSIEETNPHKSL